MSTNTLDQTETTTSTTDAPMNSHIVNCPPDKESTAAWITEARIYGLEVTALCGYRWVPQHDPKRFPVCPACTDAAGIIMFEGPSL